MFVTPSPGWGTFATPRPSSGPPSCTTQTSPGAVAWNAVRRFSARTRITTAPTIPTRPTPATSERGRSGSRGSRLLRDVNRRTDRNLVIEVDDVGDPHADAPVRRRGADRADVVGPVDAGSGEDPHPARLERVVRRAARDHLAGQRPRPRAVRHVPGGVHRLVLDVVEPRGRLEADLAYRDRVGLDRLEVLVERQPERAAVDDDRGPEALLDLLRRDLRPQLARARDERPVGGARDDRPADLAVEVRRADREADPAVGRVDAGRVELRRRVDRPAVDRPADLVEHAHDGAVLEAHRRIEVGVQRLARQVADRPAEDVALAAAGRPGAAVRGGAPRDVRRAGPEPPRRAVVVDDDRALERLDDEAVELGARLRGGQPLQRDAADPDALADLVGPGVVVRDHPPGESGEYEADQHSGGDEGSGPQRFPQR